MTTTATTPTASPTPTRCSPRAIGWSQHGFCINCGVDPALVEAVYAAYGAPVLAALEAEAKRPQPREAKPAPRRRDALAR